MYQSKLANLVLCVFVANTFYTVLSVNVSIVALSLTALGLFLVSFLRKMRVVEQALAGIVAVSSAYVLAVYFGMTYGFSISLLWFALSVVLVALYQVKGDWSRFVTYPALVSLALGIQTGAIVNVTIGWPLFVGALLSTGVYFAFLRRDYVIKHVKFWPWLEAMKFVITVPLFSYLTFFLITWVFYKDTVTMDDLSLTIPFMLIFMILYGLSDSLWEKKHPSRLVRPVYGYRDDSSHKKKGGSPYESHHSNEMVEAHQKGEITDLELANRVSMNQVHERRKEDECDPW